MAINRDTKNFLTAKQCDNARGAFYLNDGGGMALVGRITKKGTQAKSWDYRYTFDGHKDGLPLGSYARIGLATAREKRDRYNALLGKRIDPRKWRAAQKKKHDEDRDKDVTFAYALDAWMAKKKWQTMRTPKQVKKNFERHVLSKKVGPGNIAFGNRKIEEFDFAKHKTRAVALIKDVLEPVMDEKLPTGREIAQRIHAVLVHAYGKGWIDDPLAGDCSEERPQSPLFVALQMADRLRDYEVDHHPSMPWQKVPEFMTKVRGPIADRRVQNHPWPKTLELCKRVAALKALDWSQNAIANELGLKPAHVSKLVARMRKEKVPPKEQSRRLASELLEFTILTMGVRVGQCASMCWDEIQWNAETWTTPKHKTFYKSHKPHIVILNTQAIAVLKRIQARQLEEGVESAFVFARNNGAVLSGHATDAFMHGPLGIPRRDASVHGFRTSSETWAVEEKGYRVLDVALQQGRRLDDQEDDKGSQDEDLGGKAYSRYIQRLNPRRKMVQEWGDYCDGKSSAEIVPFPIEIKKGEQAS
jgi:Arm DNA-binding domain/Phage integrase family